MRYETKNTEPSENVKEAGVDYGEDMIGTDLGFYVSSNQKGSFSPKTLKLTLLKRKLET